MSGVVVHTVFDNPNGSCSIDISFLPNGVYVLKMIKDNNIITQKLIKTGN